MSKSPIQRKIEYLIYSPPLKQDENLASSDQVIHDPENQVTHPNQLQINKSYSLMQVTRIKHIERSQIKILDIMPEDKKFLARFVNNNIPIILSLADYGLISYDSEGNVWNASNYILPVKDLDFF